MKTDDLIEMLARSSEPVDRRALTRRFASAVAIGAAAALILVVTCLGIRPDIGTAAATSLFWIKLAFPCVVALGALGMATRLARPGVEAGWSWSAIVAPTGFLWLAALLVCGGLPAAARLPAILGQTWRVCPVLIGGIALPSLVANLWALRGLAPTRLRLSGAAAGLLAGSIATMAYCLHCPEMAVPFWACWYVLGMLVPTAIGAICGPTVLRW